MGLRRERARNVALIRRRVRAKSPPASLLGKTPCAPVGPPMRNTGGRIFYSTSKTRGFRRFHGKSDENRYHPAPCAFLPWGFSFLRRRSTHPRAPASAEQKRRAVAWASN